MRLVHRVIAVVFLTSLGFHLALARRVPGLFAFGIAPPAGTVLDGLIGLSPLAVFILFGVVVADRAARSRTFPWPLLWALVGSFAVAIVAEKWIVDPLPLNGFKAVSAYFYLATPVVTALGVLALWTEWRLYRREA